MTVYKKNPQYAQELEKRYHDKHAKLKSYSLDEKVWLNHKYIKTKCHQKFFGLFKILHPVKKQIYKLKLLKRQIIHDLFHVSLLEQDITKKRQVNETMFQQRFEGIDGNDNSDGKKYEVQVI